jgi:hypothetical protein
VFDILLKSGAVLDVKTSNQATLMHAVASGGVVVRAYRAVGRVPARVLQNLQEMAMFLSAKGLSVNAAAADGFTPLFVAIKYAEHSCYRLSLTLV